MGIEIERSIKENEERVDPLFSALHKHGFRVSIDDFGAKFLHLAY